MVELVNIDMYKQGNRSWVKIKNGLGIAIFQVIAWKKKSTFTWRPVWERGNIFQLECKVLNVWGCVVLFPWASFSIWESAFLPSPWDHGQKYPFFTVMSVETSVEEKTVQILYQWIAWPQLTQGWGMWGSTSCWPLFHMGVNFGPLGTATMTCGCHTPAS